MAKVVITIEDMPDGKVKVVSDPNFETMMVMHDSGHPLTAANGYAFTALNAIRNEAKRQGPTRIFVPRIGR